MRDNITNTQESFLFSLQDELSVYHILSCSLSFKMLALHQL